ncbi:MAG: DUF262 domain-containing protein [Candidatus Poribacteria bacterium]|nr:DUF262 domain-containing protein [Candidatus Poribacteria bacterium]
MKYSPTSHPISWFTEAEANGNLTLTPDFQRRPVWTDRQKSNLIESILLKLPVPEIYMQLKTDAFGNNEYIVVDGQQRITAILEFIGVNKRDSFELRNLDSNSRWMGYTFNDLTDEKKAEFYGHVMAVRYLQEVSDDEVEDLFRRLNKYLTPLNPQELRNATYRGPFLRMAERLAADQFWSENRLVTPNAIRRMRDIEFVSDLLIGVLHGPQSGNAKTLDEYYTIYEDYEHEFPGQRDCRRRFITGLELIQEIHPDIRSKRWSNKTDFYSLFTATTHLLVENTLPGDQYELMRKALDGFTDDIIRYQETEDSDVGPDVISYIEAMRRGSSDKHRRGVRHQALLNVISPFFKRRS